VVSGSDKPASIGLYDGNSGIRNAKVFGPPSDPTKGGSVHERNPSAWVWLAYRRRNAKPAGLFRLRFIRPKQPVPASLPIKNQKSSLVNPFSHARQHKERMMGMACWLWAKRNFHKCPQRLR
jgi:hypothetical protein